MNTQVDLMGKRVWTPKHPLLSSGIVRGVRWSDDGLTLIVADDRDSELMSIDLKSTRVYLTEPSQE